MELTFTLKQMSLGELIKIGSSREFPYTASCIPLESLFNHYQKGTIFRASYIDDSTRTSYISSVHSSFDDLLLSLQEHRWESVFEHATIYRSLLESIIDLGDDLLSQGPAPDHNPKYQFLRQVLPSKDLLLISRCEPLSPALVHEQCLSFWEEKILPLSLEQLFGRYGYPPPFKSPFGGYWRPSLPYRT